MSFKVRIQKIDAREPLFLEEALKRILASLLLPRFISRGF